LAIFLRATFVAAAIFTAPMGSASQAHADDPCTGDPGCPHFGHLVCEQIDSGLSSSQVAENAMVAYDLSKIMAASLVAGAIVKYCPWDEGN
jgi:hypothetical protein